VTGSLSTTALLTEVKSGVGSSFRVIRCRFILSGKNDELTPDFFPGFLPNDELTPDFFPGKNDELTPDFFHRISSRGE